MFKKNIKNKIITGLIAGMAICATVMPTLANNCKDRGFDFNFGNGYWQTTVEDTKQDDSYVYMRCDDSWTPGDAYDAYVWGYNQDINSDFQTGGPYRFYQGTETFMTNYVYENDGDKAYIKARHAGAGIGVFSGVWSPDSV